MVQPRAFGVSAFFLELWPIQIMGLGCTVTMWVQPAFGRVLAVDLALVLVRSVVNLRRSLGLADPGFSWLALVIAWLFQVC